MGKRADGILRRWPGWAGYAAAAWAPAGLALALSWAAGGSWGYPPGGTRAGRAAAWLIAALLLLGALMAVCSVRPTGRQLPRWWPLTGLWAACALTAAGTFGFVMNALQLAFTATVDDWAWFGVEVWSAAAAVLFGAAALAYQRGTAGACARCGTVHGPGSMATAPARPSPAPRAVRRTAYAGAAAFLPYVVMKTTWAFGGSFAGIPAEEVVAEFKRNGASGLILTLEKYGLDFTTLSATLGIFLLLGLTHSFGQVFPRWAPPLTGRRVPRWLPLAPAWLGALTLGPYGVIATVLFVFPPLLGLGDLPDKGLMRGWSGWTVEACGVGAFACYGVALGVAAWSYQRRTRPRCVPAADTPDTPPGEAGASGVGSGVSGVGSPAG